MIAVRAASRAVPMMRMADRIVTTPMATRYRPATAPPRMTGSKNCHDSSPWARLRYATAAGHRRARHREHRRTNLGDEHLSEHSVYPRYL